MPFVIFRPPNPIYRVTLIVYIVVGAIGVIGATSISLLNIDVAFASLAALRGTRCLSISRWLTLDRGVLGEPSPESP